MKWVILERDFPPDSAKLWQRSHQHEFILTALFGAGLVIAYVDRKFWLSMPYSTFLACESGLNSRGLCVGASESNSRRNNFVHCLYSQWCFDFQARQTCKAINLTFCVLCSNKAMNRECYGSFEQKYGFPRIKDVNGSRLSLVDRECRYIHQNGPSSHAVFLTFSSALVLTLHLSIARNLRGKFGEYLHNQLLCKDISHSLV